MNLRKQVLNGLLTAVLLSGVAGVTPAFAAEDFKNETEQVEVDKVDEIGETDEAGKIDKVDEVDKTDETGETPFIVTYALGDDDKEKVEEYTPVDKKFYGEKSEVDENRESIYGNEHYGFAYAFSRAYDNQHGVKNPTDIEIENAIKKYDLIVDKDDDNNHQFYGFKSRDGLNKFRKEYGKEMLKLINQYRKQNGKKELFYAPEFDELSNQRARDIAIRFDHTRPNGDYWYIHNSEERKTGDNYYRKYHLLTGENIHKHTPVEFWSPQIAAKISLENYKESPEHNAQILSNDYTYFSSGLSFKTEELPADDGSVINGTQLLDVQTFIGTNSKENKSLPNPGTYENTFGLTDPVYGSDSIYVPQPVAIKNGLFSSNDSEHIKKAKAEKAKAEKEAAEKAKAEKVKADKPKQEQSKRGQGKHKEKFGNAKRFAAIKQRYERVEKKTQKLIKRAQVAGIDTKALEDALAVLSESVKALEKLFA